MKHAEVIPSKDAVTSETTAAKLMSLESQAAFIGLLLHFILREASV